MQTKLISVILAGAFLAPLAAQAVQPGQSYVGVNVGRAEQRIDFDIFDGKETDTSVRLYGGYQFNRTFGLEGGHLSHGEVDHALSGVILTLKPRSLYLAATATLPLSEQASLFAKLGVAKHRVRVSIFNGEGDSIKNNSALVGLGASYAFTPTVSGVVEYEHFGKILKEEGLSIKANVWSLGVRAAF